MDKIESFYRISAEYCNYVTENEINHNSIPFLMELLMKLYISALNLPDLKPETIQMKRPLWRILQNVLSNIVSMFVQ